MKRLFCFLFLLLGCKTVKYSKNFSPENLNLKTDKIYSYRIYHGLFTSDGLQRKNSNYLYISPRYELYLLKSLVSKLEKPYTLQRVRHADSTENFDSYSFYPEKGMHLVVFVNKEGEIIGGDFCPLCDSMSSVADFEMIDVTCCQHKPKHCCRGLKEISDTTKKYNCVWE